jgi:hypothetical protein
MAVTAFSEKLDLVLKALSVSRGRLAADIGVDKSLVSRWCSGLFVPSTHNLAALTRFVAARHPGFTMLDWDAPLAQLATRFGVSLAPPPAPDAIPAALIDWLTLSKFREVGAQSEGMAQALAGFWRTTRQSPEMPGRYIHDYAMIQPRPGGPMRFRIGVQASRLEGWAVSFGDQLFGTITDTLLGVTSFFISNHLSRPKVDVMDGVVIGCLRGGGGVPSACTCLFERIGDLSGDEAADDQTYTGLHFRDQLAPAGSVHERVIAHLHSGLVDGGHSLLSMPSMTSIARSLPF